MPRGVLLLLLQAGCCSANAFHDSVAADDVNHLKALIDANTPGLNEKGNGGQSPLMQAVLMGRTSCVKLLLAAGADTSIAENDGYTPMHGCAHWPRTRGSVAAPLFDHT